MKSLFNILPEDFFKPLTSKYKKEYADCIQLLFHSFKSELSYGVDREIVLNILENYFEENASTDMVFDDEEEVLKDSRSKASKVIRVLKDCKWIDYEQEDNYRIKIVLYDYAVTMIESFTKIINEDEMEYQSVISQIHALLQNQELYSRPYEYILKKVNENTQDLLSGLKKLGVSIKKYIDQQSNEMKTDEIIKHFFEYYENIGSKAYHRMKTNDNVSYFRNAIYEKLDEFIEDKLVLESTIKAYMEIEEVEEYDLAHEEVINMIHSIKSSFYHLDDIIEEIDRKHTRYTRSSIRRAEFLLSSSNNMEGKLSQILKEIAEEYNGEDGINLYDEAKEELLQSFNLYTQNFLDIESLSTIAIPKKLGLVDDIKDEFLLSQEEKERYVELWDEENKNRFSRKNINDYVGKLLKEQERIQASCLPLDSKRDLIRLIYIQLYGKNKSNCYETIEKDQRISINDYGFPDFDIVRRR